MLRLKYSSALHFFMEMGKLKRVRRVDVFSLTVFAPCTYQKEIHNISVKKNCRLLQLMIIEAYKKYI
jgi:hypothetical protein